MVNIPPHGGGHIDTPPPERPGKRWQSRPRLDTPDPVHETAPPPPPAPEPRIWQVRLRVNPYFMGREKVLQQLHTQLQHHTICHLRGPRGSGTTQTALAYAYRARNGYDAVFWLDGRSSVLFRLELSRLADDLGLTAKEELGYLDRVNGVARWLETNDRWLMVIDGIVNFDAVRELVPHTPRGKVLLSGHRDLEIPDVCVLDHGAVVDASARRFLEHRSQQPDADGLDHVVALFEGNTLPLYLAGAYCHAAKVPLSEFAEKVTDSVGDCGAIATEDRALRHVTAAVAESLHYLSEIHPAGLELMALCAHLDCENIPLLTLFDGAPFLPKRLGACVTAPKVLDQTLTLLFRLGLVQFEQNSITIHPHIQIATRRLLGGQQSGAWLMTALRVVLEAFPVEAEYTLPIPACTILVRHALAVTRLSEKAPNLKEGTGTLLNQVGLYLHACDELEEAQRCFERAIALAESLYGSTAHPTVASRTNSLGVVMQDRGCFEEACACYRRAFELCEAVYGPARDAAMGPAHRSMLTMPSRNLCQVLELMGDIPAAKAAYKEAIEIFIEVYCWNHSVVAECLNGLGQLCHRCGELTQAQQCFLRAVQAEENAEEPVLGALSQYTRNLAQCLMAADKFEEARKFYEHALYCDREDFGQVNESVVADLMGLARTHRARSRFVDAHCCLDEAMVVLNTLTSSPTSAKASVWRLRGRCHLDANDYVDSVACFREALKTGSAALGPDSSSLGPDYIYVGRALDRMEQYRDAEEALLQALRIHEATPWLDDEELNGLLGRLVRVCRAQENYAEAAAYQLRVLEGSEARFGDTSDRVGADAYSLGNLYLALGELEEATHYLERALTIYTGSRGADDERTVRVRRKLELALRPGVQRTS